MDVQTSSLGFQTLKARTQMQAVVESALPLPPGRDAASVLFTHGTVRVTEAVCGKGSVRVGGELLLTLLCTDPSNDPFGFTAGTSFTQTVEADGVLPAYEAAATAQVLECECAPAGEQVTLSMVIELSVTVLETINEPVVTGITCAEAGLNVKSGQIVQRRRALLGQTELRMRETVDAPDAVRVLISFAAANVEEVSFSGGAATVSGKLYLCMQYENESGELIAKSAELPFTDAFEAAEAQMCFGEAAVKSLSVTAADAGFSVCDVEAVLEISLYGPAETSHSAVLDAYDVRGSFQCETMSVDPLQYRGTLQKRTHVQEEIAVPKHLPEAQKPLFLSAMPLVTGVDEANGQVGVDVMLLMTAVYRCEAGYLHSFSEDVPVRFLMDGRGAPVTDARVHVLTAELSGGGRRLGAALSFQTTVSAYEPERFTVAAGVTAESEQKKQRGILIYCADEGETLWDVGKRFLVPTEDILQWNEALSDPLPEGQQIVLMR